MSKWKDLLESSNQTVHSDEAGYSFPFWGHPKTDHKVIYVFHLVSSKS